MLFILSLLSLFSSIYGNPIDKFNTWVNTFQIQLQSPEHYFSTFDKWLINDEYIYRSNQGNKSYTLGHNQFSGMDDFDFRQFVHNHEFNNLYSTRAYASDDNTTLPLSVDWRDQNAVTPVKDQGQCGSCWAFSTTGSLEGIYAIQTGKLVSFSEQQLVDCDNFKNGGNNYGCNGGDMDSAFSWIGTNNGLCSEESYPYVAEKQSCQSTCNVLPQSQIRDWVDVQSSDIALMAAIAQQPVSIAIEADQIDFQLYQSGVLTAECGTTLDHGVLVVGYGTEEEDYYLVKNSWGTSWGDQGYIKLGRGPQYNNGQGQCGILLEASYPII